MIASLRTAYLRVNGRTRYIQPHDESRFGRRAFVPVIIVTPRDDAEAKFFIKAARFAISFRHFQINASSESLAAKFESGPHQPRCMTATAGLRCHGDGQHLRFVSGELEQRKAADAAVIRRFEKGAICVDRRGGKVGLRPAGRQGSRVQRGDGGRVRWGGKVDRDVGAVTHLCGG
ncbi:hypothetical protein QMO75_00405 [Rhodomicrobium lacus]|nr:hypothetical protein [Rhodomicrobium lacus]WKW50993.1 hypothetical protein QMO75_00405 [Rhodomicrobium lacus]